jgi:site-specific DNA-methyltransferase (adenine-specific)
MTNRLYYGDNLEVLREAIGDESVDLIYLDPPFNSNAGYNVLFKSASGAGADASIEAFDDTWTWGPASQNAMLDITSGTNRPLTVMMQAMHSALGDSPLMAYLAMMAVRLVELHRVLKPTGSLYLHCDPTASHYLKLVLDAVFGAEKLLNEIIWKRTSAHSSAKRFGPVHDIILFYAKSSDYVWNRTFQPYSEKYISEFYTHVDGDGRRWRRSDLTGAGTRNGETGQAWRGIDITAKGRHWAWPPSHLEEMDAAGRLHWPAKVGGMPMLKRYLDEQPGNPAQDIIDDIPPMHNLAAERLHYPTQKPRALLERLIAASSNPGDVVLDPFCGCGTAVDAAQKLGRQWIGIDVTHIAIGMIEDRMRSGYPGIEFETIGVPKDLASAERLAADDPHQFQQWVCWQVGGFPRDKKGGDKGVDGWFNYERVDPNRPGIRSIKTGVISVKAGDNVNPSMVRDLGQVMKRDGHDFGLFIMKSMPTKGMRDEASSHPLIEQQFGGDSTAGRRFSALQIVTLAEFFQGKKPDLPPLISPVKKANRVETRASHQKGSQGALGLYVWSDHLDLWLLFCYCSGVSTVLSPSIVTPCLTRGPAVLGCRIYRLSLSNQGSPAPCRARGDDVAFEKVPSRGAPPQRAIPFHFLRNPPFFARHAPAFDSLMARV